MRCGQITLPSPPHSPAFPLAFAATPISNRSPISFRKEGGGGEFTLCYFYRSFVRRWVVSFEGSDFKMGSEKGIRNITSNRQGKGGLWREGGAILTSLMSGRGGGEFTLCYFYGSYIL